MVRLRLTTGWRSLQNELRAEGYAEFQVIGVAIDENPRNRELTADVDTDLVDADHVLTELCRFPTCPLLLINEDDSIAMPNWSAYGSNLFSEFTGVEADRQHDRIRRWVRDGDAGMSTSEAVAAVDDLTADEEAARLHFRLATTCRDRGDAAGADRTLARAAELAPYTGQSGAP